MRVRLILRLFESTITKLVELDEEPAVGSVFLADRERLVTGVEHYDARGEVYVYLQEDEEDDMIQLAPLPDDEEDYKVYVVPPRARLAHIMYMQAEGWRAEDDLFGRRDSGEPGGQEPFALN
ncbi:hypothetical protein WME89_29405 [Sorangium sp. So ce321]|uniref:hypothetical protein n=1 Tax=Sorangium sp. So ce321 TaxID=3133300 RepID=UPI003F63A221